MCYYRSVEWMVGEGAILNGETVLCAASYHFLVYMEESMPYGGAGESADSGIMYPKIDGEILLMQDGYDLEKALTIVRSGQPVTLRTQDGKHLPLCLEPANHYAPIFRATVNYSLKR